MHPTYKRMLAGLEKKKNRASRRKKAAKNDTSLRGARKGDAAISFCKNETASCLPAGKAPPARNDVTAKETGNVYKTASEKEWSLYILKCSDETFYTGITNNLERRLKMHQAGKASRYTRTRGPVEMLYSETCGDRSSALIRECEVKEWPRARKERLISGEEQVSKRRARNRKSGTTLNVKIPNPAFSLCVAR